MIDNRSFIVGMSFAVALLQGKVINPQRTADFVNLRLEAFEFTPVGAAELEKVVDECHAKIGDLI